MRRLFSSAKPKQVKRVAVELKLNDPLNIYDLRKLMFARMIAFKQDIPFTCYSHSAGADQTVVRKNREILKELMEVHFDVEVSIDSKDAVEQADEAIKGLKQVE